MRKKLGWAAVVVDQHADFERALAESRRRYPAREFRSLAEAVRGYVQATRGDEMIHRNVGGAVHGLVEYLQVERKRVPNEIFSEAERLECLLFLGYDPYFDETSLQVFDLARRFSTNGSGNVASGSVPTNVASAQLLDRW